MPKRFALVLLFCFSVSAADAPKKEARLKEIPIPPSAAGSMVASLGVRWRFAKEKINPGSPEDRKSVV